MPSFCMFLPCVITYNIYKIIINYTIMADLDECALHLDSCDNNADCKNINGSYDCTCRSGYHGNGFTCNGIIVLMMSAV